MRERGEVTRLQLPAQQRRERTGGGDLEHADFGSGSCVGADPYAPLVSERARDVMVELARAGRARVNERSGFDAPVVFHAMGEGALACGDEVPGASLALWTDFLQDRAVLDLAPRKLDVTSRKTSYVF